MEIATATQCEPRAAVPCTHDWVDDGCRHVPPPRCLAAWCTMVGCGARLQARAAISPPAAKQAPVQLLQHRPCTSQAGHRWLVDCRYEPPRCEATWCGQVGYDVAVRCDCDDTAESRPDSQGSSQTIDCATSSPLAARQCNHDWVAASCGRILCAAARCAVPDCGRILHSRCQPRRRSASATLLTRLGGRLPLRATEVHSGLVHDAGLWGTPAVWVSHPAASA